jgi:hypothetical protein
MFRVLLAQQGRWRAERSGETLKQLTIEQLTQIDVTTVTKHAEPISEAAGAISVITQGISAVQATTLASSEVGDGRAVARSDGHT